MATTTIDPSTIIWDTPAATIDPSKIRWNTGPESMQESMGKELAGRNWLEKFNAGWGAAGLDTPALGLKSLFTNLTPQDQQRLALNRQILASGWSSKLGGIGGTVSTLAAPSSAIGAAAGNAPGVISRLGADVAGQAALGAGYGAVTSPGDRQSGAVVGALAGGAGAGISQGMQGIFRAAKGSFAEGLQQEGVPVTMGQTIGGVGKVLEDASATLATNVSKRQNEAVRQWATNIINSTLPGGKKVQPGSSAINDASQVFDDAYDKAFQLAGQIKPDNTLRTELLTLFQTVKPKLTPTDSKELGEQLQRVGGEFKTGSLDPRALRDLRRSYTSLATDAANNGNNRLSEAYTDTAAALTSLVGRNSPKAAAELAVIDSKYGQFLRVQRAAGKIGAEEGMFSPQQLRSSIRELDQTADKRAFARGTASPELRQMAEQGADVLGPTIPPVGPGTAQRMMLPVVTGSAGMAYGSGNPYLLAPIAPYAAAGLLYTKTAQQALTGALPGQSLMSGAGPAFATAPIGLLAPR